MSQRRFSFSRFMDNTFPSLSRPTSNDEDLSPLEADYLYRYQIQQPNPQLLDEQAFRLAGVLNEKDAKRAITALMRSGILDPVYGVDTRRITRHLVNQLAPLPMDRQRKIVSLLFHWEGELRRLRALEAQASQVQLQLAATSDTHNQQSLEVLLQSVEMRRNMLPSERERNRNLSEELPTYSRRDDAAAGQSVEQA